MVVYRAAACVQFRWIEKGKEETSLEKERERTEVKKAKKGRGKKKKKNFSPGLQRHRRLVARHRRVQLVQLEVGVPDRVVHLRQVRRRAVPARARALEALERARVELLAEQDDAELERVLGARGLGADALAEDLGGLLELAPDQDLFLCFFFVSRRGGGRGKKGTGVSGGKEEELRRS